MAIEIVSSSPKAQALSPDLKQNEKYPFDTLNVGQSFTVKLAECNWKSLRVCVYQRNARSKDGRRWVFIKHDDLQLAEVARVA